jgi:hypothetical protein
MPKFPLPAILALSTLIGFSALIRAGEEKHMLKIRDSAAISTIGLVADDVLVVIYTSGDCDFFDSTNGKLIASSSIGKSTIDRSFIRNGYCATVTTKDRSLSLYKYDRTLTAFSHSGVIADKVSKVSLSDDSLLFHSGDEPGRLSVYSISKSKVEQFALSLPKNLSVNTFYHQVKLSASMKVIAVEYTVTTSDDPDFILYSAKGNMIAKYSSAGTNNKQSIRLHDGQDGWYFFDTNNRLMRVCIDAGTSVIEMQSLRTVAKSNVRLIVSCAAKGDGETIYIETAGKAVRAATDRADVELYTIESNRNEIVDCVKTQSGDLFVLEERQDAQARVVLIKR